ncbi:hypothetical protein NDU88_002443 [Pleurodeles waltl]|uniref:Uncharacterized protein n=1 Tax=Pleurodeles waltl TaxID=8319 RepID=A0AAV7NGE6_PLEWA|nr:hypothetical protein NDU88_002443 [Pleurodeles waltl]
MPWNSQEGPRRSGVPRPSTEENSGGQRRSCSLPDQGARLGHPTGCRAPLYRSVGAAQARRALARDDISSFPIKGVRWPEPSLLYAAVPCGATVPPPGRPALEPPASNPLRASTAPLRNSPPGGSRSLGVRSAVGPQRQPCPVCGTPGDGPGVGLVFADK